MSRGTCAICGRAGVGVHRYPGLYRLATAKALTVKVLNMIPPMAHEPCYRALEKLACRLPNAPQEKDSQDRDDRLRD